MTVIPSEMKLRFWANSLHLGNSPQTSFRCEQNTHQQDSPTCCTKNEKRWSAQNVYSHSNCKDPFPESWLAKFLFSPELLTVGSHFIRMWTIRIPGQFEVLWVLWKSHVDLSCVYNLQICLIWRISTWFFFFELSGRHLYKQQAIMRVLLHKWSDYSKETKCAQTNGNKPGTKQHQNFRFHSNEYKFRYFKTNKLCVGVVFCILSLVRERERESPHRNPNTNKSTYHRWGRSNKLYLYPNGFVFSLCVKDGPGGIPVGSVAQEGCLSSAVGVGEEEGVPDRRCSGPWPAVQWGERGGHDEDDTLHDSYILQHNACFQSNTRNKIVATSIASPRRIYLFTQHRAGYIK